MISSAGRITLAKTVLSSIPTFFMQLEQHPTWVPKEINKLVRRCVWGEMGNQRRINHLSSKILCRHKEFGVALCKTVWMYKALTAKLAWKILTQEDALWVQVVRYKYCKGEAGSL